MKTILTLRTAVLACLLFSVSAVNAQKKDKDVPKKVRILPVYLDHSALPDDTAFVRIVREAFTRHKVKLINRKEFDQINDAEILRIVSLIRTRQDKWGSESELKKLALKEMRPTSNMMTLSFQQQTVNDSVIVTAAIFENTAFPESKSSGEKTIEIKDTCCSLQDQVFALVDEILNSKWLK